MGERWTVVGVLGLNLGLGFLAGAVVEDLSVPSAAFLAVSTAVIFGLGIAFLEGPSLILSIALPRRITRMWVRNSLQAGGPFLAFVGYVAAYGLLLHPPFSFSWPWIVRHA
ncbi:MAG: hypothetical protein KGJ23_06175 [Euryarchaeota archaeon]|nr:hypothetical protein [Euryarchaeota archaeon]MDE1836186.1 hypothetical protein [Euryarchaeota archaeon]MDE1881639.1 hypothetical protein [Euryarchaeota archaeon]MDE2045451.1 hypothetical protein [Thermoplasmata archaeon]